MVLGPIVSAAANSGTLKPGRASRPWIVNSTRFTNAGCRFWGPRSTWLCASSGAQSGAGGLGARLSGWSRPQFRKPSCDSDNLRCRPDGPTPSRGLGPGRRPSRRGSRWRKAAARGHSEPHLGAAAAKAFLARHRCRIFPGCAWSMPSSLRTTRGSVDQVAHRWVLDGATLRACLRASWAGCQGVWRTRVDDRGVWYMYGWRTGRETDARPNGALDLITPTAQRLFDWFARVTVAFRANPLIYKNKPYRLKL